jgi:hypothetical protein
MQKHKRHLSEGSEALIPVANLQRLSVGARDVV